MRPIILAFLCLLAASCATPRISDYEGRYEYEDGATLVIAARPQDGALFAVVNGARYPLRPAREDVFVNSTGDEVHFVRGESGRVVGYWVGTQPGIHDGPLRSVIDRAVRLPAGSWRARPRGAPSTYAYEAPPRMRDGLATQPLAADAMLRAGLSDLVQAVYAEEFPNLHSVLVYRDGALVFETYFYEFDRETLHQMRSATKTLMALLAGAAVDRGLISIDAPVLSFFPQVQNIANVDERKRAITIRDLLSMRSGFDCNDWNSASPGAETRMVRTNDWVRFILDLPMSAQPGSEGAYCSGNVILVGRILERATGRPLRDFADEVLFAPLGIQKYEWDFRPDRSNTENFVQAWLRPRDMMKIGVLILNEGAWNGRRIIAPEWIGQITRPQSEIEGTPYGYFWWVRYINTPSGRFETPQASGNGGQKIIVLREQNAVIVLTGGNYNEDSNTNKLLARFVVSALQADPGGGP